MNRRSLLGRLSAGAAALAMTSASSSTVGWAQSVISPSPSASAASGGGHSLRVVKRSIEVNGKAANVYGLQQPNGATGLILDADSVFDVSLSNQIDSPTLIHWHGLTPPWRLDGVPDNPEALLQPGEARPYKFPVGAGGTHWMHAHTLQEQNLLAAPLIVRTAADRSRDEQEVVVLLHDFSFKSPEELFARLKGQPNRAAAAGSTSSSAMSPGGMGLMQHGSSSSHSMPPGTVPMDVNDIDYDAYLANDRSLLDPEIVTVERHGRVRLRIINGATATAFTISTGGVNATLIAVDGQDVAPVAGRSFPMAMGQRIDLRLELPKAGGAFPILALREGARERTGILLASQGAAIKKIDVLGGTDAPILGLELEQKLRALSPLEKRLAARRFTLALGGDMAAYNWSIDGGDALNVKEGDRVEMLIKNMSMMAHPMHLHGHHFQVIGVNEKPFAGAVRDTVLLPPMASVTIAFDAKNPGRWPLHCHHLYHMAAGMMSFVNYSA